MGLEKFLCQKANKHGSRITGGKLINPLRSKILLAVQIKKDMVRGVGSFKEGHFGCNEKGTI